MHDRERQAGIYPEPPDKDGASSALTVVATLFGAGKPAILAQEIEQTSARIGRKGVRGAVNAD
jgi:hypothetical protein